MVYLIIFQMHACSYVGGILFNDWFICCFTVQVLKVCRTPGPTTCSKTKMLHLDKVVFEKLVERRKNSMTIDLSSLEPEVIWFTLNYVRPLLIKYKLDTTYFLQKLLLFCVTVSSSEGLTATCAAAFELSKCTKLELRTLVTPRVLVHLPTPTTIIVVSNQAL